MTKILFVDDDRYFASEYIECLKEHHEVIACHEAEPAVRVLLDTEDIAAVVLDIMMPPPPGLNHETHDGNTTGLWILDQCRQVIIERRIAVLLFTNKALAFVNAEIAFLQLDPAICKLSAKSSIDADNLPVTVGDLISGR